ncbi:MAG: hypothetical protein HRU38_01925 [Saccharospirillaceae bacterium]|nr:hypothetical protein [Pseudomonadales bacterium]NRB77417.1 hypothetical protein [Saccharospirillaceae bacterium]
MRNLYILMFVCVLSGCNAKTTCTLEARFGLTISLYDNVSGEPVSICDLSYIISDAEYLDDGDWIETLPCDNTFYIASATERAGVYDIQINKVGYEVWENKGVIVYSDVCHVEAVSLDAFLIPK